MNEVMFLQSRRGRLAELGRQQPDLPHVSNYVTVAAELLLARCRRELLLAIGGLSRTYTSEFK